MKKCSFPVFFLSHHSEFIMVRSDCRNLIYIIMVAPKNTHSHTHTFICLSREGRELRRRKSMMRLRTTWLLLLLFGSEMMKILGVIFFFIFLF
jgi:hypothetical protein